MQPNPAGVGIEQALVSIRAASGDDVTSLAVSFERLARHYFRNMPGAVNERVEEVFLWKHWPGRKGADTGIDLVVRAKVDGVDELWAVQAKYRDAGGKLGLGDISNVVTTGSRGDYGFTRLYLVTTVELTDEARKGFRQQPKPTFVIDLERLAQVDYARHFDKHAAKRQPLTLRKHQAKAVKDVLAGLATHERGRLVMACGTGKTLTSLRVAEELCGAGKSVLVLVPSISLMHQTILEWAGNQKCPLAIYAVCSDSSAGEGEEAEEELQMPADTDPRQLATRLQARLPHAPLRVVFATYQSIDVVARAQHEHAVGRFDLVICDEAHRTAGIDKHRESVFKLVHDPQRILSRKRLYMTATPVIHGDSAKAQAQRDELLLYSMDNEEVFGPELHRLDFSSAIKQRLLADYRLCVFMMKPSEIAEMVDKEMSHEAVVDKVKMVGSWCGISKLTAAGAEDFADDPRAMQRAVMFANTVKKSKTMADNFLGVANEYRAKILKDGNAGAEPAVQHVDGQMNSSSRAMKLNWLRNGPGRDACHILSNAKCLTEGVDVPALDAVIFHEPRGSQVDIVQALGRAMRKVPRKKRGYIILPIAIPESLEPGIDVAQLSRNKAFRPIIQIANALKAHDSTFTVRIDELVVVYAPPATTAKDDSSASDSAAGEERPVLDSLPRQLTLDFEFQHKIHAMIVKEVGDRRYWPIWAADVERIAGEIIRRIRACVGVAGSAQERAFHEFIKAIHRTINTQVSPQDVLEMVAQHIITRPIFNEAFKGNVFAGQNAISLSMDEFVRTLDEEGFRHLLHPLDAFYSSVAAQFTGDIGLAEKQRIMVALYQDFFRHAFKKASDRFGVVYTPVEIVDFILGGADHLLRQELDTQGLTQKGVIIQDPFTGTGTFLVRLLQGDLIQAKDLLHKYRNDLLAYEIMLLPHYIAAVNIEECFHARLPARQAYEPFTGLVLTDTFKDQDAGDAGSLFGFLQENLDREISHRAKEVRVILGNPPYSVGQRSQNDDNQNTTHAALKASIQETYARASNAKNKKALHDTYIKAFRWASDRLGDNGVIAFVTNGSFLESATTDGVRKCLVSEFHQVYCLNLRGNIRSATRQPELRAVEGENVFKHGSQTPIAITFLVKKAGSQGPGRIFHADVAEAGVFTAADKLGFLAKSAFRDIDWQEIVPNHHGDWLEQRSREFDGYMPLEAGTEGELAIFTQDSFGVNTSRDAWVYNFSAAKAGANAGAMIKEYDRQRLLARHENDPRKISWSVPLRKKRDKGVEIKLDATAVKLSSYRPFVKKWLYFHPDLNERQYLFRKMVPAATTLPPMLCLSSSNIKGMHSALMTQEIPNFDYLFATRCYPLTVPVLDDGVGTGHAGVRHVDNIPDETLARFQQDTGLRALTKTDVFHYVYGIMHAPTYKERHAVDLVKSRARIPVIKDARRFQRFVQGGKELAELHVNYEAAAEAPVTLDWTLEGEALSDSDKRKYGVSRMSLLVDEDPAKPLAIVYNDYLTLGGIPREVLEYVVAGRPAIWWVVNRYRKKQDKASGLVDDPNDYGMDEGTGGNGSHILSLLRRTITVSLATNAIVGKLPDIASR